MCKFRFAHVSVIKVIPSGARDVTVRNFSTKIERQLAGMGISANEYQFGTTTGHPAIASNKLKHPDDCFYPGSRKVRNGDIVAWPTFVVEADVSESVPRLHQDATWWFANFGRMARIGLVISVRKNTKTMIIERW